MRAISRVLEPVNVDADRPYNQKRTAIVICHGMGQQVKWQTLGQLVSALGRTGVIENPDSVGVRQVRFKERDDEYFLGRAEVVMKATPAGPPREAHIYEAYWAPLTEGRITLLQTVRFLLSAGASGIGRALQDFYRYGRFGRGAVDGDPIKRFPPPRSLVFTFGAALLVFLSLFVMNLTISLRQLRELLSDTDMLPRNESLLAALTGDLWTFEIVAVLYALLMVGCVRLRTTSRRTNDAWQVPAGLQMILWAGLALVLASSVVIGLGAVPRHYLLHARLGPMDVRLPTPLEYRLLRAPADVAQGVIALGLAAGPAILRVFSPLQVHAVLVWGLVLAAGYAVRNLLIQYVGDVAVYVSSHTVSTFDEVREDIKKLVRRVLCGVCEQGGYDRVIVVGHSLGSVVAYDAVNGTMLADEISGKFHVERVRRLITFGSPLDKTAFIFRAADAAHAPIREALAVTVQPLLVYTPSTDFDWINIHSRNDVISGSLDFYPPAQNETDPQADIPILAHVQFWENELLAQRIAGACADPFTPGVPIAKAYKAAGVSVGP